jgi:hypothetical protein
MMLKTVPSLGFHFADGHLNGLCAPVTIRAQGYELVRQEDDKQDGPHEVATPVWHYRSIDRDRPGGGDREACPNLLRLVKEQEHSPNCDDRVNRFFVILHFRAYFMR